MAYPTDVLAAGDLVTAAQINRWCVLLADTTLASAAASVDLTSIPAHWTNLMLVVYGRGDFGAVGVTGCLRFNNDSAGNYDQEILRGNNATASALNALASTSISIGSFPGASGTANYFGMCAVLIPNYANAVGQKASIAWGAARFTSAATDMYNDIVGGFWRSTAAINRVTVFPNSGNFEVGTRVSLYGMGRI